ncbi:MAG: hypothetical protein ACE5FD_09550 [Anaerolineae bacterium]
MNELGRRPFVCLVCWLSKRYMNSDPAPLIIGFVTDLMFTSKIENVARHLGFRLDWFEEKQLTAGNLPFERPG